MSKTAAENSTNRTGGVELRRVHLDLSWLVRSRNHEAAAGSRSRRRRTGMRGHFMEIQGLGGERGRAVEEGGHERLAVGGESHG